MQSGVPLEIEILTAQNIFDQICQLAKEGNEQKLKEYIDHVRRSTSHIGATAAGFCVDANRKNPIVYLIEQGEFQAALFLINKFGGYCALEVAVTAAAHYGHEAFLNTLLKLGENSHEILNGALLGAVEGGQEKLIYQLLNKGADKNFAVFHAARTDLRHIVMKLVEGRMSLEQAVKGATSGGHVDLLNQLVDLCVTKSLYRPVNNLFYAMNLSSEQVYLSSCFINAAKNEAYKMKGKVDVMEFLAKVKHPGLRKELAKIVANILNRDVNEVVKKANWLNNMMNEYEMTYTQAHALTILSASEKTWLLQVGPELVKTLQCVSDIYYRISLMITNLDVLDTRKIIFVLNKHLFDSLKVNIKIESNSWFKSNEQIEKEKANEIGKEKTIERFRKRPCNQLEPIFSMNKKN